jgi:hypothetical protein
LLVGIEPRRQESGDVLISSSIPLACAGTVLAMLVAVSSAACSAIRPPRQGGAPELRGTEVASAMLTSSAELSLPATPTAPAPPAEGETASAEDATDDGSEPPVIELDDLEEATAVLELDESPVIELDEPRVAELAEPPIIELDEPAVEVAATGGAAAEEGAKAKAGAKPGTTAKAKSSAATKPH